MGDAEGDGAVPDKDPEATIDAITPAEVHEPVQVDAPAADYAELLAVEREHYVVDGEIAKGGMGRVIAAHDRRLGRDVAIKELLPKNRHAVRRFEREARITARLQHPAIIHVYEAGTWPGGEPFYAMPKVSGRSLDKVVEERATLNDRLGLIPNVIAVTDALAYAHSQRVIHRDLKPSNVLVGEFGETVVIDWGLAKDLAGGGEAGESLQLRVQSSPEHTSSGSVVGTPAYMPPEQARGEAVDERADVYALGALLYKVLVGRAPYTGETAEQVIELVKLAPPRDVADLEPGAPRDLVAIVAKAMARVPSERYANAGELAADLKRFQTGQLVAAHRYTSWQLVRRWLRRRLLAVSISTIAILVIAAVAAVSVQRIVAERARAETRRFKLLEERGRAELLDGHPGRALVYLAAAAQYGVRDGVRGMLIADAARPFEAQVAKLPSGPLVAVSPDGKHIATAGRDVVVWSTSGTSQRSLGEFARQRALAWDSAGKRLLAAGDDGKARVWGEGPTPKIFDHGTKHILDAAFDAKGTRIATASEDGTAIVWSVATGKQLAVSTCHGDARVVSVRFSDAGDQVATASEDGTVCVWSADNGKRIKLIHENGKPIETVQWTHDDEWLVTASVDGTARVWSAELGKPVVAPLQHEPDTIVRLAVVSHDGRFIVTAGSDRIARVWELPAEAPSDGSIAPARRVATLAGHSGEIVSAAFSSDDSLIATGGADRLATVWDRKTGQVLGTFEHGDVVDSVAFAEADKVLVTGSRNGQTTIWHTPEEGRSYELFGGSLHALATAPDGTLAVGTENNSVLLVKDGKTSALKGHDSRVLALAFTPDGKTLISGGEDPRPIVWDVATRQKRGELGDHTDVRAIAVSPDGARIATAGHDTVRVWTVDGKLVDEFHDQAATIYAVQFSPIGDYLEIGADDGSLIRWRPGAEAKVWKRFPSAITALAHSDRALAVATASAVEIYPRAGAEYGSPVPLDGPGEVRGIAFTDDGSRIITVADGGAKIFDAASGKLVATRASNGRVLEALAVRGDDLWLAGKDGFLGRWSIHVDARSPDDLNDFVRRFDPWMLCDDDIIQLKGAQDGQRGSNCK